MPEIKVTVEDILQRKSRGEKIAMLTAYDYPMATLVDASGADIVLVGDSLGMVVLGYETPAPVTMDEMIHHAKAARRGVSRALFVGDMPLSAFAETAEETVAAARRFMTEAGCEAIKIEWKNDVEEIVADLVADHIPVMGHVGLTPQTAAQEGGFGMRGKDAESAARIVAQSKALERVGCFSIVLECVPDLLAQEITARLKIPTVGIGSGPHCDGQVLVTYDLIGLFERFRPRFVKRYADVATTIRQATSSYVQEVKSGAFPAPEQTVAMKSEEFARLKALLEGRKA